MIYWIPTELYRLDYEEPDTRWMISSGVWIRYARQEYLHSAGLLLAPATHYGTWFSNAALDNNE